MKKFQGFVVAGFVHGGGEVQDGAQHTFFEDAWAEARSLSASHSFGDSVPGVRLIETDEKVGEDPYLHLCDDCGWPQPDCHC